MSKRKKYGKNNDWQLGLDSEAKNEYYFGKGDTELQNDLFDDQRAGFRDSPRNVVSGNNNCYIAPKKVAVYQPASTPSIVLKFTPYAWAKLLYMRSKERNEVSGFGISGDPKDLTIITDFALVKQEVSTASANLEDDAVADFLERSVEQGLTLEQCSRIWIHTHPGFSCSPSGVDEETFGRVFKHPYWACMLILGVDDTTYARIKYNIGPVAAIEVKTMVDFTQPFRASDHEAWAKEYKDNVSERKSQVVVCSDRWSDQYPNYHRPHDISIPDYIKVPGSTEQGVVIVDQTKNKQEENLVPVPKKPLSEEDKEAKEFWEATMGDYGGWSWEKKYVD